MNKHFKGILLLSLGLFLMPFVVHFGQGLFLEHKQQLTMEQSIIVAWFIVCGITLSNTIRSWME